MSESLIVTIHSVTRLGDLCVQIHDFDASAQVAMTWTLRRFLVNYHFYHRLGF